MLTITPQIKDKVLADLLSADNLSFDFNYEDSKIKHGFPPEYIKIILNQFEELGLIKKTDYVGNKACIDIQIKAMDLYRHGGFTAEEELLRNNIEKLGMELDLLSKQLAPKFVEKASQLAQIGGAIMQGLTLFR